MAKAGTAGKRQAELPRERTHFRALLLADQLEKSEAATDGGPPQGNTTYEELMCVGYQPQLKRLDAVVHIKQENGFSGGICTDGSQEYVKFFASTDDGSSWVELGTNSFTSYDVDGPKPLEYDVTLPVDLHEKGCKDENVVLIRAILSWNAAPGDADDPVYWGNGVDSYVQVAPKKIGSIFDLIQGLDLKLSDDVKAKLLGTSALEQLVDFPVATEMTALQLHEHYEQTDVEPQRYLYSHVAQLLAKPMALSASASFSAKELLGVPIDFGDLLPPFLDPQGNQTYEQLGCVGLNTNTSELAATIHVKKSSGYSGTQCSQGSKEYVAFWADWGSGYEYVGTTSVNAYDIKSMPSEGLQYSVALPFAHVLTKRQPCHAGAKTARIRAVLSWNELPSTANPFAVPHWGGHMETRVLIPPGEPVSGGGPVLESIGSMPISLIGPDGLANGQSIPGFVANQSPFGASINFGGLVFNPSTGLPGGAGIQYRILTSTNNGATSTPMTEEFVVETMALGVYATVRQTPDTWGWCDYLADFPAPGTPGPLVSVVGNVLGYWKTSGDDHLWLAMEARDGSGSLGLTPWKKIKLDNTQPEATVAITSGGGSCGDFQPGDLIEGTYWAHDDQALSGVSIHETMDMPGVVVQKIESFSNGVTESGTWRLQTLPSTTPCGYVISVGASDRTIVHSSGSHWSRGAHTGLCLRPPSS
jgi:DNA uptake protein ComE-like DNA-binding protein